MGFPVVIEYKLDKNRTVINQGMSYMAWLRSRKAEFWKVTYTNKTELALYLHINPDEVQMRDGLRDVRNIGHWGTGNLEIRIRNHDDVAAAKPLIHKAYDRGNQ